jgi:hypothetical protein
MVAVSGAATFVLPWFRHGFTPTHVTRHAPLRARAAGIWLRPIPRKPNAAPRHPATLKSRPAERASGREGEPAEPNHFHKLKRHQRFVNFRGIRS